MASTPEVCHGIVRQCSISRTGTRDGIGYWAIHRPPPVASREAPIIGFCRFRFVDGGPRILFPPPPVRALILHPYFSPRSIRNASPLEFPPGDTCSGMKPSCSPFSRITLIAPPYSLQIDADDEPASEGRVPTIPISTPVRRWLLIARMASKCRTTARGTKMPE
jgi:hypothetical protein